MQGLGKWKTDGKRANLFTVWIYMYVSIYARAQVVGDIKLASSALIFSTGFTEKINILALYNGHKQQTSRIWVMLLKSIYQAT